MEIGQLAKLWPLFDDGRKALGTLEKLRGDADVQTAIASLPTIQRDLETIERVMADPDVKAAIATFEKMAAILLTPAQPAPPVSGQDPGIGGQ